MSLPFIEQFRPVEIEDILNIEDKMSLIENVISNPIDMPNLLFYGSQGTGKTTLVKALLKKLEPIDVLRINGSDTTGVDTIRDKVFGFATSMSSVKDKPKIVWIEEFDFMSQSAFAALRSMIEQYLKNTRYVCTCNYLHKIPEPIQSRFTLMEFSKIPKDKMVSRLYDICKSQSITVEEGVLELIADKSNGDMRTAVNNIQKLSSDGRLNTDSIKNMDSLGARVFGLINAGSWTSIRREIPKLNPDYNDLLVDLESVIYGSDLMIDKKAAATEIIARGMFEMSSCFDEDIAFAAICSRLIKAIK